MSEARALASPPKFLLNGLICGFARGGLHMRSPLCSINTMVLSKFCSRLRWSQMTKGKAGQTSSMSFAGVLGVKKRRRFRRRGDPKTTLRHRQHTCTSDCHASIPFYVTESRALVSGVAQKLNIDSRISSGSVSIVITRPTPPRVSQSSLRRDVTQRTHSDMHDFPPSASL